MAFSSIGISFILAVLAEGNVQAASAGIGPIAIILLLLGGFYINVETIPIFIRGHGLSPPSPSSCCCSAASTSTWRRSRSSSAGTGFLLHRHQPAAARRLLHQRGDDPDLHPRARAFSSIAISLLLLGGFYINVETIPIFIR